ncbi:HNH endonuclease [uncultured Albimonas sp.]|uniref:HNH endonuclease n=1 Tax=uncultured Albimonas sp. TaxID=1331701 RepID=UPI0030EBADF6|tara:strand:- start:2862 stop:3173 length:312 start_codon:yes stop_codon:yes gene_type:complete
MDDADPICPLCLRPIPPGARASVHHLTPKLKGGARGPTARMHKICHDEIHARLTEAEIAREAATPEALRAHPALARFRAWVAAKPPEFDARTLASVRRRRQRR